MALTLTHTHGLTQTHPTRGHHPTLTLTPTPTLTLTQVSRLTQVHPTRGVVVSWPPPSLEEALAHDVHLADGKHAA